MLALITGGSSGIGRAICTALLTKGHRVVNADITMECKDNCEVNPEVEFIQCDVRDAEKLCDIVSAFSPDILVNNVGILRLIDFLDLTLEDYQKIMDINLRSCIFATKAALPKMIERRYGNIVNISSLSGIHASMGEPLYGATKAAIINFTMSIAGEYGKFGVRCNCICPGSTKTKIYPGSEDLPEAELRKIPLGRMGNPEEIAEVAASIIDFNYLNGVCIPVDGGKLCGAWRRD